MDVQYNFIELCYRFDFIIDKICHFHVEQGCYAEWNLQKKFTYNYAIMLTKNIFKTVIKLPLLIVYKMLDFQAFS